MSRFHRLRGRLHYPEVIVELGRHLILDVLVLYVIRHISIRRDPIPLRL